MKNSKYKTKYSSIFKDKDIDKLIEHSLGSFLGDNLGNLASVAGGIALSSTSGGAVAGVPMIASGASGLISNGLNNKTQTSQPDTLLPTINTNPIGQYRRGGRLDGKLRRLLNKYPDGGGLPFKAYPKGYFDARPPSKRELVERGKYLVYDDNIGIDANYQVGNNDIVEGNKKVNGLYDKLYYGNNNQTFINQFPTEEDWNQQVLRDKVNKDPEGYGGYSELKSGGWIAHAVNPAHKGYCTPMTKSTCTPRRKAFARRAKAHFKEDGGMLDNINNEDIIQYNTGSHESGKDQMVNSFGVPTNNPNDAVGKVELQENSLGGYVFSDNIGFDKNGLPTYLSNRVHKTFAQIGKSIDKKYGGKLDEMSQQTKDLAYTMLKQKNEEALNMKKQMEFGKFQKAASRFMSKYGGYLHDNGGILDNIQAETEGYFFPQGPVAPQDTPGFDQNKMLGIDASKAANGDVNTKEGGFGNTLDYLPAIGNLAFGLESTFSKSNNYKEHIGDQELSAIENLDTKVDTSANLARNQRLFNANSRYSNIYTPATAASNRQAGLSANLYANNDIFNKANELEKQGEFQKAGMIDNSIYRTAAFNQQGEHQYSVENAQDQQARREGLKEGLIGATKNIGDIQYNNEVLKLIPSGWKYLDLDKDGNIISKDNTGNLWYINRSTGEKTKAS